MKAKLSNLELVNFVVQESAFKITHTKEEPVIQIKRKLHKRKFRINFNILESSDDEDIFLIELEINSFPKSKRISPGYDFMIKLTARFYLKNRKKLPIEKETQYILYSALPMTISLARTEISHLSANGTFGTYILPAIDMQYLVKNWIDGNR